MPGTATTPEYRGFQSPKQTSYSRYTGLSHGDSPGDVEASQDIFWDSTSPGSGLRSTRVVEISDIVNRIAPQEAKPKGAESPLLQWIGDSAVSCTPEIPKPRLRKKSSRQSSVEELMKLAKQFDKNMQQDQESSEQHHIVSNHSRIKQTESSPSCNKKDLKVPSSLDRVEAELHALFDSSTQKVSGPLSQGSSASDQPVTLTVSELQQSELKLAPKSDSAIHHAEVKRSCGFSVNNCDDFDDDWENDDLLNDPFVLATTQNPDQLLDSKPKDTVETNTKTNTAHLTSVCKPTANTNSAHQPSLQDSKPRCSVLQEMCPKPKTTNRSTFKLESNPHFQAKTTAKEVSKSSFTVLQTKLQMSEQKSITTKILATPQTDKITNDQRGVGVAADSVKDISDSLWDDGDDDALFYQVCDSVERISNSQTHQVSPVSCQEKQDIAVDRQRKTTAPLPIDRAWSMNASASANRQSLCTFVRSNSLPGTSCESVNYRGWNVPMKSAKNKSGMSQSLPGSHVSLATFSQCRDSFGTFQPGNAKVDMKAHTVTARAPQNSWSSHTAFKRTVSDSAATSSKVFVTSQMTGKCSAAEIERKKQEALARRRLRMQNTPKP